MFNCLRKLGGLNQSEHNLSCASNGLIRSSQIRLTCINFIWPYSVGLISQMYKSNFNTNFYFCLFLIISNIFYSSLPFIDCILENLKPMLIGPKFELRVIKDYQIVSNLLCLATHHPAFLLNHIHHIFCGAKGPCLLVSGAWLIGEAPSGAHTLSRTVPYIRTWG